MVVTASLARGAVRAAVEKHAESFADFKARLRRTRWEPPSTMRRVPEWLRKHTAVHERDALLIVTGMVRRRSAAFSAFHPAFNAHDAGWNLGIYAFRIVVSPGRLDSIDQDELPLQISGHALERIFQRTNEIKWNVIRDYLASATAFAHALSEAYAASGCKQCAVPAERGLLVGQIEDGTMNLRTFLPDSQLGLRWQALFDGLNAFADKHRDAINAAGIARDERLAVAFTDFLRSGRYGWLFRPYAPGDDLDEDAWRSRDH